MLLLLGFSMQGSGVTFYFGPQLVRNYRSLAGDPLLAYTIGVQLTLTVLVLNTNPEFAEELGQILRESVFFFYVRGLVMNALLMDSERANFFKITHFQTVGYLHSSLQSQRDSRIKPN